MDFWHKFNPEEQASLCGQEIAIWCDLPKKNPRTPTFAFCGACAVMSVEISKGKDPRMGQVAECDFAGCDNTVHLRRNAVLSTFGWAIGPSHVMYDNVSQGIADTTPDVFCPEHTFAASLYLIEEQPV